MGVLTTDWSVSLSLALLLVGSTDTGMTEIGDTKQKKKKNR